MRPDASTGPGTSRRAHPRAGICARDALATGATCGAVARSLVRREPGLSPSSRSPLCRRLAGTTSSRHTAPERCLASGRPRSSYSASRRSWPPRSCACPWLGTRPGPRGDCDLDSPSTSSGTCPSPTTRRSATRRRCFHLEHAMYFGAGGLLWWPVLQDEPWRLRSGRVPPICSRLPAR